MKPLILNRERAMAAAYEGFEQRKREHITHALDPRTQTGGSGLEAIDLIHEAIPDLDFDSLSIETMRFKQPVPTPFIISAMTAGHLGAKNINFTLATAASEMGWAMGVGSQRRELNDPNAQQEWQTLRRLLPDVTLFSNLGITQLITSPIDSVRRLIDNIEAKALIIHTNPLQECLQQEGTPQFRGAFQALEKLCQQLACPVVLKETGCGFSAATLSRLNDVGLAAIDLSGFGGTHWGRIEGLRNEADLIKYETAQTFKNWGISTLESLKAAREHTSNIEIWGSGGVRSGLDAAKLLALGASTVGFAKPILEAALEGPTPLIERMRVYHYELKTALFCTGSKTITDLQEKHRALIP